MTPCTYPRVCVTVALNPHASAMLVICEYDVCYVYAPEGNYWAMAIAVYLCLHDVCCLGLYGVMVLTL